MSKIIKKIKEQPPFEKQSPKIATGVPKSAEKVDSLDFGGEGTQVMESNNRPNADNTPLLDFQAQAPSPSQSYFQIALYKYQIPAEERKGQKLEKEMMVLQKSKLGCLVLREWPRKRYSQNWSRDGALNPNEKVIEFEEFIEGEYDNQVRFVFGSKKYEQLLKEAKKQVELKNGF